jgi:NADH:ubiquinone oxidoreductase subunit C
MFFKKNGFTHLSAVTGAKTNSNLIEILYHLDRAGTLVTIRVALPPTDSISTITDIILGASLYEREIHDLFGVKFEGHPDLSRLILPDEWENGNFPLRN